MAFNYSPKIVTDGLVLYLDAANSKSYVSGSTAWNDISRGGNNGTLVNGPTFDSGNGGSIVFDGVNNYVISPSSNDWALGINGAISAWVYFTGSITTNHRLWCVNNNLFSLDAYVSIQSPIGVLGLHGGNVRTTTLFPRDQWVHVMVTYNSGNISIYFNGANQPLAGILSGYNITNPNPLFVGQFSGGGSFTWRGRISNLNIYKNKPFSPLEVLQNYNTTKTRFGL